MEFRILGPVEVRNNGQPIALGGGKQRALLCHLLLQDGKAVSTEWLIDALWGERPPASAPNSVHVYVSKLRKALGGDRLVTRNGGYALETEHDDVDLRRFESLLGEGRELLARGDPTRAAERLSDALELWRGPALPELADTELGQLEIYRLEELRLAALEERVEAGLRLGRAGELVPELEALVRVYPLRERPRGQLMLALYRSGRQAEALRVYREGRRKLVEELGLDPGSELRRLELAILNQDPALAAPPPRAAAKVPSRRVLMAIVSGAGALLALVLVALVFQLMRGQSVGLASVAANTVGVIDPTTNRIVAQIPVGVRPGPLAAGSRAVWVANLEDRSVSRLDPATKTLVRTISTDAVPTGIAVGADGRVWVAGSDGSLSWIDPKYNRITSTPARLEKGLFYRTPDHPLAVGFGSVWASDSIGQVERVSASTGTVVARTDVGRGANGIAIGAGSIWIASTSDGIVSRVDPTGVVTATIPVGHGPVGVAFGEGSLWVAVSLDGIVARIDPDTNAVVAVIDTGGRPRSVVVGVGAVWVADSGGRILRIDPSSSEITSTIHVGASPGAVAVVGGSLWTTVTALARKTTAIGARDATLRVEVEADPGVVDPAVSVNPQIDYATCAYLLNYPDVPAPAGSQLVPEVAESMPSVSRDGRSYTFGIRPGFRFSPPSNQPVTAQTFKDTIERTLDPRIDSEGASLLFDVVGAKAFNAGHARHIAGIVVDGDTLTIRLTRAVGDLPSRLAEPYFCAVPSGTPVDPDGVRDIPMAGPYYVASYVPGQQVVLERNPNYGGDRPEGPGHIDYAVGVSREHALAHVRSGQADYAGDGVPLSARSALRERFGPGSAAARAGHQQFFSNPALGLRYLVLNTQRPLFANVRLRRAVSYAIDRTALARIWNRYFEAGTLGGGSPSADYLPPGMRVSSMHVPYPLRADVKKARSLAGTKRREAVLFTCDEPPCPQQAAVIKADLRKIGIDVIVKAFPVGVMYARAAEPGAPYDLLRVGWGAEYTDPAAVLEPLFRGGSSSNFSQLDDPAVDRRLDAAAQLIGSRRARAYEELARWLAAEIAPIVVFENDSYRDFLSRRVGCHVFNPVYGVDLAALCLR